MVTLPKERDLSYFELRLLELLNESYPELAKDKDFVSGRSTLALDTYVDAVSTGNNHLEASYMVNEVLFSNLPFSKMDMLFDVICNEFDREIKDDEQRSLTEQLYSVCQPIFGQYELDKGFEDNPSYDALYTELTGTIRLWMDENLTIS